MTRLFFVTVLSFLFLYAPAQEDTAARMVLRNLLSDAKSNFKLNIGNKHYSGGRNYDSKTGFRGDRESIALDTSALGHTYFASSSDYSVNRENEKITRLITNLLQVIKELAGSGEYTYTLYVHGENAAGSDEKEKKKKKDKGQDKNDMNRLLTEKEKYTELDVLDKSQKRVIRIVNSEKTSYNLRTLSIFVYADSWKD